MIKVLKCSCNRKYQDKKYGEILNNYLIRKTKLKELDAVYSKLNSCQV